VGFGALIGSALAAALFGILGQRARERDSVTGVVLAFGLGLAVLFIHLYPGRTATSFALLTGQIVGVGYSGLTMLALVCLVVIAALATCYRPLLFATVDPNVAAARGVPVRADIGIPPLGGTNMALVGTATSASDASKMIDDRTCLGLGSVGDGTMYSNSGYVAMRGNQFSTPNALRPMLPKS
jgi:hypothetical protein